LIITQHVSWFPNTFTIWHVKLGRYDCIILYKCKIYNILYYERILTIDSINIDVEKGDIKDLIENWILRWQYI